MPPTIKAGENVFEAAGYPHEEAVSLDVRAGLMGRIKAHIDAEGWTPEQAAAYFESSKLTIHHILKGRIDRLGTESLIGMAAKTCKNIRLEFEENNPTNS